MNKHPGSFIVLTLTLASLTMFWIGPAGSQEVVSSVPAILTPPEKSTPAIHGPRVFGVRPGSPFLYTIPATGARPMRFSARHLPRGLKLNPVNGEITGSTNHAGEYHVVLGAKNTLGTSERPFTLRVGEEIALTPSMGWNSYNVWGTQINSERVLAAARAMVDSGLNQHGFTYINIDDGWQGRRGGPLNAVQPDPASFKDMASLATQVHAMG